MLGGVGAELLVQHERLQRMLPSRIVHVHLVPIGGATNKTKSTSHELFNNPHLQFLHDLVVKSASLDVAKCKIHQNLRGSDLENACRNREPRPMTACHRILWKASTSIGSPEPLQPDPAGGGPSPADE